jgi:hypothetical protein
MKHEVEEEERVTMRLFEGITPMCFHTQSSDVVKSVHLIAIRRSQPWRYGVNVLDDVKFSKIGAKVRKLLGLSITDAENSSKALII